MFPLAEIRRQTRIETERVDQGDSLYMTRSVSIRSWRRISANACLRLTLCVSVLRRQDLLDQR